LCCVAIALSGLLYGLSSPMWSVRLAGVKTASASARQTRWANRLLMTSPAPMTESEGVNSRTPLAGKTRQSSPGGVSPKLSSGDGAVAGTSGVDRATVDDERIERVREPFPDRLIAVRLSAAVSVGQHQVSACRVVGRRNLQAVEQQRKQTRYRSSCATQIHRGHCTFVLKSSGYLIASARSQG